MNEEATNQLLFNVSAIVEKYNSIAAITGENFNVFNILGLGSREVKLHSALIAELLNPKGSHGQRSIFLSLFVRGLLEMEISSEIKNKLQKFDTDNTTVIVEKRIGPVSVDVAEGGYIDIIIESFNGDAIIIENKIYAADQRAQLRRYYNYNPNAHIVYLTLKGLMPSDFSTQNDGVDKPITPICISYKIFILDWLERCKKESVNHPLIRETIAQYIYLLKQLTNQAMNNNMKNEIVEMVVKSPDLILSTEEIIKAWPSIKLKIIKDLEVDIEKIAKDLNLNYKIDILNDNSNSLGEGDTGFKFFKDNWDYCIYYYFEGNEDNLWVGIDHRTNDNKCSEDTIQKINDHFKNFSYGKSQATQGWIWGTRFNEWDKTTWSEVKRKIPGEIQRVTEMFLEKLKSF